MHPRKKQGGGFNGERDRTKRTDAIGIITILHGCISMTTSACHLVGLELSRVFAILKDRPSWLHNCRAMDFLNVLSNRNGRTIELLYMHLYASSNLAPDHDFWLLRYTCYGR